jgi:MFS family permease
MKYLFVFLCCILCFSCKIRQKSVDGFYGSFGEPQKLTATLAQTTPIDTSTEHTGSSNSDTIAFAQASPPDTAQISPVLSPELLAFADKLGFTAPLPGFSQQLQTLQERKRNLSEGQFVLLVILSMAVIFGLFLLIYKTNDVLWDANFTETFVIYIGSALALIALDIFAMIKLSAKLKPKVHKPNARKRTPYSASEKAGRTALILSFVGLFLLGATMLLLTSYLGYLEIVTLTMLLSIVVIFLGISLGIGSLHRHRGQGPFKGKVAAILATTLVPLLFMTAFTIMLLFFGY